MQEEKEHDRADSPSDDATSSETLSDVEEKEDVSDKPVDVADSEPLSPDGAGLSDTSERSPKDDGGPM